MEGDLMKRKVNKVVKNKINFYKENKVEICKAAKRYLRNGNNNVLEERIYNELLYKLHENVKAERKIDLQVNEYFKIIDNTFEPYMKNAFSRIRELYLVNYKYPDLVRRELIKEQDRLLKVYDNDNDLSELAYKILDDAIFEEKDEKIVKKKIQELVKDPYNVLTNDLKLIFMKVLKFFCDNKSLN